MKPYNDARTRMLSALFVISLVALLPGSSSAQTFSNQTSTLFNGALVDEYAAWGDFNNDGYVDLFAGGYKLWINNAGTGFSSINMSFHAGIWGDYDNDGHLDLFNWQGAPTLWRNSPNGTFTQVAFPTLSLGRSNGASWGDHDNDGDIDLYVGGSETPFGYYHPDAITTNQQGTSFTVTWEEPVPFYYARGITSCDFDEDGDLDIYVSHYRLQRNWLLQNNGSGVFTDVAGAYGVAGNGSGTSQNYGHTIGSAWGDLDNDGDFDLFVGNFAHDKPNGSGKRDKVQDESKFYKNLGAAGSYHFQDMTSGSGLAYQESYANPALGDYDNDGDLDLFLTTVYLTNNDHCVLYRNDGNWHFTDVTSAAGLGGLTETYQAAWADFDNDGDLDLVADGKVFVNAGNANNWLKVRLVGNGSTVNAAAIGARVDLVDGAGVGLGLVRQVEAGTGEGNQNDMTLHFGLGPGSPAAVNVHVRWPDGTDTYVWNSWTMNQTMTIAQPSPQCPLCQQEYCQGVEFGCRATGACEATCCYYECGVFLPNCIDPECPPNVCGGCSGPSEVRAPVRPGLTE